MIHEEKYSIKAQLILYQDNLMSGYICIEGQYIAAISTQAHPEFPVKHEFVEQVIMPGAIDTSVSLNAAFEKEWSHVESFTKCALSGGTTLIVNKPYQYYEKTNQTDQQYQIEMYLSQVEDLRKRSFVDFLQSSFINSQTIDNLDIMRSFGANIFYGFLSHSNLQDISAMNSPSELRQVLQALEPNDKLVLHLQKNTEKEGNISSPYRQQNYRYRLSQEIETKNTGQDGLQGQYSSSEESDTSVSSNEGESKLNQELEKSSETVNPSWDSRLSDMQSPLQDQFKFRKSSKQIARNSQHQLLSRAEYLTYENVKKVPVLQIPSKRGSIISIDQRLVGTPDQRKSQFSDEKAETPKDCIFNQNEEKNSPDQQQYTFPNSPISTFSPEIQELMFHSQKNHKSSSESSDFLEFKLRTRSHSNSSLLTRRQNQAQQSQQPQAQSQFTINMVQVTAESSKEIEQAQKSKSSRFTRDYLCFLAFRPDLWERYAIKLFSKAQKDLQIHGKVLLSGFSASATLSKIITLENKHLFTEISYPYLMVDSDMIAEGQTQYKADPPFRSKENRRLIQKAISSNKWVHCVGSGHFYVDPTFKFTDSGDFRKAYSGTSTIGYQYQATWTTIWQRARNRINIHYKEAKKLLLNNERGVTERITKQLIKLQQLISTGPAQFLGEEKMGKLKIGGLASIVVWDPFSKTKASFKDVSFDSTTHLFAKQQFLGRVDAVFIRGRLVYYRKDNQEVFNRCD